MRNNTENTSWVEQVYELVKLIPKGRVSSYGAIARSLGITARMVGRAMGASREDVPAHRVVNHAGKLTGKASFATPTLMEESLAKEGIQVKNDKVVNFPSCFWDPVRELGDEL